MSVQHEYRCEPKDKSHALVTTTWDTPVGEAPKRPDCPWCGRPMAKVFRATLATNWRRGR